MNEEAGFIAALLAEPDDRTTLLVYADWLDERNDPRGQYLRELTEKWPNQRRLDELRRTLDSDWVNLIDTRDFRVGSRVWVTEGEFEQDEGKLLSITPDRRNATVLIDRWDRGLEVELQLTQLELVSPE